MKKKPVALLLSSAFLNSAPGLVKAENTSNIQPINPAPCNFSGAYVGLTAGYGVTKDTFLQTQDAYGSSPKQATSLDGITGGIMAGWGRTLPSHVYMGIELSYLFHDQKVKDLIDAVDDPDLGGKKKDAIEMALRLGFVMNKVLPYLKLGWSNAKFETTFEDQAPKIQKDSKRLNGFLVGVGADVKVAPKILLGLEYTCAFYGKWKGKRFELGDGTAIQDDHIRHERKPESHNFMLRVAYTF